MLFQVLEATTNQLQLFELAAWEQGLWFVCAFLNLASYGFWVVYMFEIIQVEVDAIKAQQEVRGVRRGLWRCYCLCCVQRPVLLLCSTATTDDT